jgi:membrane dipeptidase
MSASPAKTTNDARAIHRRALVWDNHACLPLDKARAFLPEIRRFARAGVDVLGINIGDADVSLERQLRMAADVRDFIDAHPGEFVLALTVADIERAKAHGRLAVFFDVEGGYAMGDQLSVLQRYADLGVRWMLLVYNKRNLIGSGVHDEIDEGLTEFGRQVVAELDRVGIIKCCSHTGYRTAREVLEHSTKPVIFSHSNPRALKDHPRNIPDELIRLCAKTGGVVCINGVGIFLGDNDVRTQTFADHIDYVASLVGVDHVGLGLDYMFDMAGVEETLAKNADMWPAAWGYKPGIKLFAPEQLPELTETLLDRGHSEGNIEKILGGNMLRVAEEVWP